jgi:tetratricopeptide (TPR) repeat protein
MKKKAYLILTIVSALLVASIFIFAKEPKKAVPTFKERSGSIALSAEWLNTKEAIKGLITAIDINPDDNKSKLQLAQAYIQESRISGDHAYYDKAALELLGDVVKAEPKNFDALCCKATVLLSQHHFAEALEVAKRALPINPNSAFIYGLMCDANVELGNYAEAVKHCDKMVSVRPDIRSYSRISYLREIHGDLPGAIQAAKLAVAAGYPGLEQTEWTRTILAHLYENIGQLDSAKMQYQMALAERPGYAFAIAGLGKIEKAKGNYKEAISLFENAKKNVIDYSFDEELTDLYRLNKQEDKAEAASEAVIEMLSPVSNVDESSNGHGHYADKELAYAYLKVPDLDKALQHAKLEYDRRPDNIDVCETLAWVYYKKGAFAEANKYINKALITNNKNPLLLCHAGLIKVKAGETDKGRGMIRQALESNPYLDPMLKNEAVKYLPSV